MLQCLKQPVDFSGVIWTLMFGNVYERDIILSTNCSLSSGV